MAKVYEFPVKVLPVDMEKCLYELGKEYGAKMNKVLDTFIEKYDLDLTQEDLVDLMLMAYANGILDVIAEMEE